MTNAEKSKAIEKLIILTKCNDEELLETLLDEAEAFVLAYTKNNILIQSAQAMLAQANQVPQGVLQLLQ